MKRKSLSDPEPGCGTPGSHEDHLCMLAEAGQATLVTKLSCEPNYLCGNCGIRANQKENLCRPKKL